MEVGFATDSLVEGDGFEFPVPRDLGPTERVAEQLWLDWIGRGQLPPTFSSIRGSATASGAVARGQKMGRPPKLTPHQRHEAIKRRDEGNESLADIGRSYNVSAATISRLRA